MNKYERMEITEQTLKDLDLIVPSVVTIGAHINTVIDMLERGDEYEAIIAVIQCNCKPSSFATNFKKATNISIKEFNLVRKRDNLIEALKRNGINSDMADKILEDSGFLKSKENKMAIIENIKLNQEDHYLDKVTYIPQHANGDINHEDVDQGVIISFDESDILSVLFCRGRTVQRVVETDLIWG